MDYKVWGYAAESVYECRMNSGDELKLRLIMAALCNRGGALYFCPVVSFYLSFFSSPNLSGHRLDVYHTSTHDVALVQI